MTRLEQHNADVASRWRKASHKAARDALLANIVIAAAIIAVFIVKAFG